MKNSIKAVILSLAYIVAVTAINAADKGSGGPVAVVSRYSGVTNVPARTGTAITPLRIEIKDWHFVRTPEGVRIPSADFYLAQLKSGQIDTEMAGKKEHRKPGDIWAVAAGESMTVIFPLHSQSAQLQTITITLGAGAR